MMEEERIRQYAELAAAIAARLFSDPSLTAPESQATVSAGPEVEPQHLTNQSELPQ
jgi:hypothetical protein